ncbi:MAG: hypothetical protein K2P51_03040 [Rhabdochlamydiaceae bacterium]|nr:hypothetical protein [Rhabdochlamydiaceae bacterium]
MIQFNKLLPLLFCAAILNAEDKRMSSFDKRLSALEAQPQVEKRYNPPEFLTYGFQFSADALYWQARENGTAYALKNYLGSDGIHSQKQDMKNLSFDWDFGFRIGAAYIFPRDRWLLSSQWTHFDTKAKDLGHGPTPDLFIPIWSNPDFAPDLLLPSRAKARWHLNLNQIDVMLSRPFHVSKYLVLNPEIGPSGLWLKQHYRLKYRRLRIDPGHSHVRMTDEFSAIGLRAGLDTRFGFPGGWGIFNETAFTLYYGEFQLHRKETYTLALPPRSELGDSIRKTWRGVAPVLQLALGIRYDHPFNNDSMAVTFKLAWETAIYFSQNQFLRFVNPNIGNSIVPTQGDITLCGGTFSAGFVF